VENSEAALNRYRRDKGILSLDEKENIIVERLNDFNKRLTEAEAERIALEAQVRLIRKRDYDSLPAVINSTLIQTLKEHLAKLEGKHAQLAARFKSGYLRLAQLEAQVAESRNRLQQEIQGVVGGIESAYLAAEAKEKELRAKMEEQKAATLGLKDASVEYAILVREVNTNRQLYDSILQRMKEMGVAAELRTSNISVIDKAEPPVNPSSPQKKLSLLLSALVGLLGGVGLAFFCEYLDNTLKTPEEVERYLRLPNLGIVPDFSSVNQRGYGKRPKALRRASAQAGSEEKKEEASANGRSRSPSKELVLAHHPLSVITEAYRTLRTSILLSRAGEPPRITLFTSGTHGEGKTSTVINTAVIFAQMGVRVLVIDADLRRPRCHKILGIEHGVGLSEVLTGQRETLEVIKPTALHSLFFLGSGAVPPNPAELVGSRKMHETLTLLQEHYDYILIDSPPVMPVSDAVLLSTMVDGVVLVVKGQETPKQLVKETCARLGLARAKILGVVLNGVNMRNGDYAYYYRHYSSYYHQGEAETDLYS
jgi:capsular exopolysaccharide synthesis family protein